MKKAILIDTRYAVIIAYTNLSENPREMYEQTLSLLEAESLKFVNFIGDDGDHLLAGFTDGVFGRPTGMYLISNDNGDVKNSVVQVADLINSLA